MPGLVYSSGLLLLPSRLFLLFERITELHDCSCFGKAFPLKIDFHSKRCDKKRRHFLGFLKKELTSHQMETQLCSFQAYMKTFVATKSWWTQSAKTTDVFFRMFPFSSLAPSLNIWYKSGCICFNKEIFFHVSEIILQSYVFINWYSLIRSNSLKIILTAIICFLKLIILGL